MAELARGIADELAALAALRRRMSAGDRRHRGREQERGPQQQPRQVAGFMLITLLRFGPPSRPPVYQPDFCTDAAGRALNPACRRSADAGRPEHISTPSRRRPPARRGWLQSPARRSACGQSSAPSRSSVAVCSSQNSRQVASSATRRRPECPRVTRVTIANMIEATKPMVAACSGARPIPRAPSESQHRVGGIQRVRNAEPDKAHVQHGEQADAQALHQAPAQAEPEQESRRLEHPASTRYGSGRPVPSRRARPKRRESTTTPSTGATRRSTAWPRR